MCSPHGMLGRRTLVRLLVVLIAALVRSPRLSRLSVTVKLQMARVGSGG